MASLESSSPKDRGSEPVLGHGNVTDAREFHGHSILQTVAVNDSSTSYYPTRCKVGSWWWLSLANSYREDIARRVRRLAAHQHVRPSARLASKTINPDLTRCAFVWAGRGWCPTSQLMVIPLPASTSSLATRSAIVVQFVPGPPRVDDFAG